MTLHIVKLTLLLLFSFVSPSLYANVCEQLNSPRNILDCALISHPDMKVGEAGVKAAGALESVAKQRPNPEVNSQTVWAKTYGKPYFYTEYNFAHTFELGGKRDARIEKAKSELLREEANRLDAKEQVYLGTLINLFRLRQLKDEIETVNDALTTFAKIQTQYRARPRLSPEQQANLRLFELAEEDYRMRLIPLEAEVHFHLKSLEIALGKSYVPEGSALPQFRKQWPTLPNASDESDGGAKIKIALADLKASTTELTLAKSSAWPDLKIGPTFELQNSIGQNFAAYGFNFILPLPLYHRNGAGKAFANLEIKRSELRLEAERKQNREEKSHNQLRYVRAVEALKNAASKESLEKKHIEVEKLFNEGLIQGNLVIELHRQIHDFTKTYNAQELMAVEALTRVYMLQGKIPEDIVW